MTDGKNLKEFGLSACETALDFFPTGKHRRLARRMHENGYY